MLGVLAPTTALAAPPAKPSKAGAGAHKKAKGEKASHAAPTMGATKLAPAPAAAKAEAESHEAPVEVKLDLHRATLANGLRVVVDVDHTSPTVAIAVVYDVGARDEERGRSGFAHLFEHMMFQGSRNVPRGDHLRLIAGHGGEVNGTTNADRTSYFEQLPENELALGLWLEADRMRSLDVSQQNFENQRKVVQEEYRMRVSNAAYQPSRIRLEELVYQGYWPYEHPTIGSMADLDGAQLPWVQAFHAAHYGPSEAVLAIAGDVDAETALGLVHRYFDEVPGVPAPPKTFKTFPALPEQTSQRTATVEDDHARTPGVLYGWAVPPARSADHYAVDVAGDILAEGESSRLYQLLVRDKAVAQSVSAGAEHRRGPDLFRIDAVLAAGAKPAEVEKLVEAEIAALAARGPTPAELTKAHRRIEAGFVLGLQSNLSRARRLGEYEVFFGDAGLLAGELSRYRAVTGDDVKRAVAEYLGPTRRTVVETYPTGGSPTGSAAKESTASPKPSAARPPAPAAAAPSKKGSAKPRKHKKS